MAKSKDELCFDSWRTRDELRAAESRAVAIHRRLNFVQQSMSSQNRKVMDDAVKLADTIEHFARLGQVSTAEDAVEIASYIEVLVHLLETEIDNLLTS